MVACRFDDMAAGDGHWLFDGLRATVTATTLGEVAAALEAVEAANRDGLYAAGWVAYEAAPAFDAALAVRPIPASDRLGGLPLVWFGVFTRRMRASPPGLGQTPADAGRRVPKRWCWEGDREWHGQAVASVLERIAAGWTYQANVTTRLYRVLDVEPAALYAELVAAQGCRYGAFIDAGEWVVACASPELFFRRKGAVIETRPMKGTAERSPDPDRDRAAAARLRESPKERAENLMVADLLRNDLGRLAEYGAVTVPALFTIEAYPNVWQMTSTVRAVLRSGTGLPETFAALFPCGSVTGAPKAATMGLLAALEPRPRGVYCGAVGWSGPIRRGVPREQRFAVAIRTATVRRSTGDAEFGVGSGITVGSRPTAEWDELVAKSTILDGVTTVGR